MQALFQGRDPGEPVVCLHTWGQYPFQYLSRQHLYGRIGGEGLARVYDEFREAFPVDWFHVREEYGSHRDEWLTYDTESPPPPAPARGPAESSPGPFPQTIAEVDALFDAHEESRAEVTARVLEQGMYDHVRVLADRHGEVMIFPNQGAPGSGFPAPTWEDQMIIAYRHPEVVEHYVRRSCRRYLGHVEAARDRGAEGFIFSEGYGGACDLISPQLFERIYLEPKREFYAEVRRMGLLGIGYCLGGVVPYLGTIERIGMDGLMIEESKKGFVLDPVEIRRALSPGIVLFGNTDSDLLLRGSPEEIRADVARQAEARKHGTFVFINGSPICPGTPPQNLRTFVEAARSTRR